MSDGAGASPPLLVPATPQEPRTHSRMLTQRAVELGAAIVCDGGSSRSPVLRIN
jgi:hypothetical protein